MEVKTHTLNAEQAHVEVELPGGLSLLLFANWEGSMNRWVINLDAQEAGGDGIHPLYKATLTRDGLIESPRREDETTPPRKKVIKRQRGSRGRGGKH